MPLPNTAMVLPPADKAPLCAALSIPLARPDIIVKPASASSAARRWAAAKPYPDARREPTIAIDILSFLVSQFSIVNNSSFRYTF